MEASCFSRKIGSYLRVCVGLEVALSAGGPLKAVENRVGVAGLLVAAQPRVAYGVPELHYTSYLRSVLARERALSETPPTPMREAVETFPAHHVGLTSLTCTCCTSITSQTCRKGKG